MTGGDWRRSLADYLHATAAQVEDRVDIARRALHKRLGLNEPEHICAYHGYVAPRRLWLNARLLANNPEGGPTEDDSWWDNLLGTWARWESDEVPYVPMRLELAGQEWPLQSDEEGYVTFSADPEQLPALPATAWINAHLATADGGVQSLLPLRRVATTAQFGVISDLDDTVIHTGITNLLLAARLTFLHNARTRKPLEGVSELYQAFEHGNGAGGADNPIFYVSSSAWNLFDLLRDFLDLNNIPPGPMMLRDLGLDNERFISGDHSHKLRKVRQIMDDCAPMRFVLIGDSGQHDAQLYAEALETHADQIMAVYIRDVDPGLLSNRDEEIKTIFAEAAEHDVPCLLVKDSFDIAAHATELGLIAARYLDDIAAECERDRHRGTLRDA